MLNAIEQEQTQTNTSQQPITENILHPEVGSDSLFIAIPSAHEEATSLGLHVTLGDYSTQATTTTAELSGSQLDSGYIAKTLLKATTAEITSVTSANSGKSPVPRKRGI